METLEIGKDLVALCQVGKHLEAIDKYYGDGIVSIEGASNAGMEQRIEGLEAVRGKTSWWIENHEVHASEAKGPYVAEGDNRFVVHFDIDVTSKLDGQRNKMSEVGIYTVEDGKITEERFLYLMG